jgi:hypothetical protein
MIETGLDVALHHPVVLASSILQALYALDGTLRRASGPEPMGAG